MLKKLTIIDDFLKNILIVLTGSALVNFLNLLYQLLIAHKLSAVEFAEFNSLLSIAMMLSAPLGTLQLALVKYTAEFNAHNQTAKIKFLLSDAFKKTFVLGVFSFFIFLLASRYIMGALKIESVESLYILAAIIALGWIGPVFNGGILGLELFKWSSVVSTITGILKLALTFILLTWGFRSTGALGALLFSMLACIVVYSVPLRHFLSFKATKADIGYKRICAYLFPLAVSYFCFMALVSFDMVLVKHYFSVEDSGYYSLGQMVGKIFLFLPSAISLVMFPRTSVLKAKSKDTTLTLKRSLAYAFILSFGACVFYNLFPSFVLRVLTGKALAQSVFIGRLFSISMTFFALLFILISYFLSIHDLRFLKYLVPLTVMQYLAIALFHQSLLQVQVITCIGAVLLFFSHLSFVGMSGSRGALKEPCARKFKK